MTTASETFDFPKASEKEKEDMVRWLFCAVHEVEKALDARLAHWKAPYTPFRDLLPQTAHTYMENLAGHYVEGDPELTWAALAAAQLCERVYEAHPFYGHLVNEFFGYLEVSQETVEKAWRQFVAEYNWKPADRYLTYTQGVHDAALDRAVSATSGRGRKR